MVYAADTKVEIDKTRLEIERMIHKYGATGFAYFTRENGATIMFEARDRRIRFDMSLPPLGKGGSDQPRRARWRALLLVIKAKLESVESGIETFEEAFLAHVVTPGGATVYQRVQEQLEDVYREDRVGPLLIEGPNR